MSLLLHPLQHLVDFHDGLAGLGHLAVDADDESLRLAEKQIGKLAKAHPLLLDMNGPPVPT